MEKGLREGKSVEGRLVYKSHVNRKRNGIAQIVAYIYHVAQNFRETNISKICSKIFFADLIFINFQHLPFHTLINDFTDFIGKIHKNYHLKILRCTVICTVMYTYICTNVQAFKDTVSVINCYLVFQKPVQL